MLFKLLLEEEAENITPNKEKRKPISKAIQYLNDNI
jgi:hypothetical protein